MKNKTVTEWSVTDTANWLRNEGFDEQAIWMLCHENQLNGKCLLALNDADFHEEPLISLPLRDRKCLLISIKLLQRENQNILADLGLLELPQVALCSPHHSNYNYTRIECCECCESERISPALSEDGKTQKLPPEIWKAFLAFGYLVIVTWITAFVMVIVHDRVPDMKKYPPLPDIFLDNVPHIPWAFDMCEVTGTFLFTIWLIVLLFHKHR